MGVDLGQAGLAEVLPVGIVARALDFGAAAFFAQLQQGLASLPQMIFRLGDAGACGLPFLLQFFLLRFDAEFFRAQAPQLLAYLLALTGQRSGFFLDRRNLPAARDFATLD